MHRIAIVITTAMIFSCGGGPGGPSPQTACNDSARAYCAELAMCRANIVEDDYGDLAGCIDRRTASCVDSFESADSSNDPIATEACAQAMTTEACTDFVQNRPPEACWAAPGARAIDESCFYNSECSSGFCAIGVHDSCGVCAAMPVPGDDCTYSGCGHGQTCVSGTKLCQAWSLDGAQCDIDQPCTPESTCVIASGDTEGHCVASGSAVGEPCDPHHATAPGCDANLGLYCNTVTLVCSRIIYVDAGELCGNIAGDDHGCTAGAACFGTPKTCVQDADDGGACDTTVGPSCLAPARCVTNDQGTSGICTFPDYSTCVPADGA